MFGVGWGVIVRGRSGRCTNAGRLLPSLPSLRVTRRFFKVDMNADRRPLFEEVVTASSPGVRKLTSSRLSQDYHPPTLVHSWYIAVVRSGTRKVETSHATHRPEKKVPRARPLCSPNPTFKTGSHAKAFLSHAKIRHIEVLDPNHHNPGSLPGFNHIRMPTAMSPHGRFHEASWQ